MLKLIKYEVRKSRTMTVIVIGLMAVLEAYFGIALWTDSDMHLGISSSLMVIAVFGAFLAVFISGVAAWSGELKSKTSYMPFMTPNSPIKILSAKLLSTLVLGLLLGGVMVVLGVVDVNALLNHYDGWQEMYRMFDTFMLQLGVNITQTLFSIGTMLLYILLTFITAISTAYLAVTLSATLLGEKKLKGLVSFILFLAINIGFSWLSNRLPNLVPNPDTFAQASLNLLPQLALTIVLLAGSLVGSAALIKKRLVI